MTSTEISLRERRRRQTAIDIQLATLDLARESGLDNVTTEAIAERAGVSTRTFFNYYTNKEDASVGKPVGFPAAAKDKFCSSRGDFAADLLDFIHAHLEQMNKSREMLRDIGQLAQDNARVRYKIDQFLNALADDLAECIAVRVQGSDAAVSRRLAEWALKGISHAIAGWVDGRADTLAQSLDREWQVQIAAAQVMAGQARGQQ